MVWFFELLHLCWRAALPLYWPVVLLRSAQLAKFHFKNFCWFIDLQNEVVCVCLCLYTIVCVHVSVANQSKSTRVYSPVKQRGPSASTLRSSFGPKGGRQFNEIPFPLLFLCSSSLTFDTTHFCSPAHINMCVCKWVCQKFVRMFFTKKHQLLPNAVYVCKRVCECLNGRA